MDSRVEPEVTEQRIKDLEKIVVDQAITICTMARILNQSKKDNEDLQSKLGG